MQDGTFKNEPMYEKEIIMAYKIDSDTNQH